MSLTTVTIIGVVVLAALVWLFLRMRSKDLIDEMMAKRRASARLVSRADFVEGLDRIPVALALTTDAIVYQSPDIDASLDLRQIEEVEYDDETATGQSVIGKALRLRSHGHTFEFVLDTNTARQWETALPPKRLSRGTAHAV
jgi:hypothetical protein